MPDGSVLTSADIHNAGTASPSFTPDVDGDYVLRLTVSDGKAEASDNVMVTAVQVPLFDLHPETINLKSNGGPNSVTGVLTSADLRSFQIILDIGYAAPGGTFTLRNRYVDQYGNTLEFSVLNLDHDGSYVQAEDTDGDGLNDLYTLILKFNRDEIIAGFNDGQGGWTIVNDTDLTSTLIIEGMAVGTDVNRVIAPPEVSPGNGKDKK
ncbi:MAG: hypothetical protein COZ95_03255 [Nitrospirae bacterium CG_4_8_14_3_um_filter_50_41]|nr:MAG: hypothetical protein COZ95_03255 [Nitrospirae bacterium CG_4_8_14_3_um_filter_50_41]